VPRQVPYGADDFRAVLRLNCETRKGAIYRAAIASAFPLWNVSAPSSLPGLSQGVGFSGHTESGGAGSGLVPSEQIESLLALVHGGRLIGFALNVCTSPPVRQNFARFLHDITSITNRLPSRITVSSMMRSLTTVLNSETFGGRLPSRFVIGPPFSG
jgi:hypothetical protein